MSTNRKIKFERNNEAFVDDYDGAASKKETWFMQASKQQGYIFKKVRKCGRISSMHQKA